MQIQKNLSVYHYFLPTHSECTWEIGSEHAGGGEWAHPKRLKQYDHVWTWL